MTVSMYTERDTYAERGTTTGNSQPCCSAGFSLVELLIATALLSLVVGLMVAIVFQFFQVTTQVTNHLTLLGDLNIASSALARDINSAAIAVAAEGRLTLTQLDPSGGATRTVVYVVTPPLLIRSDGSTEQPVARHVTSNTRFGPGGTMTGTQLVNVTFALVSGKDTQTVTMQIGLRPQQ